MNNTNQADSRPLRASLSYFIIAVDVLGILALGLLDLLGHLQIKGFMPVVAALFVILLLGTLIAPKKENKKE